MNSSTKCGSSGRGPTRLMSPFSTLISCGSSSMLVFRNSCPNLVLRGSASLVQAVFSSLFTRMDRNFSIRNSFRLNPTRVCRNNTGPGEESFTPRAMNSISGDSTRSPARLIRMSAPRFTICQPTLSSRLDRMLISLLCPMVSITGLEGIMSL